MSSSPRRWVLLPVIFAALLAAACTVERSGPAAPGARPTAPSSTKRPPTASSDDPDPAKRIPGVVTAQYEPGRHVEAGQRVAYDKSPPFGGAHDVVWADCAGIVYSKPVRTEHMVHSLEHGTVWIAYNPEQIKSGALDKLKAKVEGQPYMMLSPYPGLDKPISLQSWGHQLKLDSPDDGRIDEFINALRANRFTTPEPGARCDPADPTLFDVTNPPPFDPSPPGPDAMPVTPR